MSSAWQHVAGEMYPKWHPVRVGGMTPSGRIYRCLPRIAVEGLHAGVVCLFRAAFYSLLPRAGCG